MVAKLQKECSLSSAVVGGGYRGAVTFPRYRCAACGNLTRFDVVTTSTIRAFHHYSVGGDLDVEDVETIAESVDSVTCRWCGHGRSVEVVDGAAESLDDTPPGELAG